MNDLQGSALSPSQTIRPLVQSPLGKCRSWPLGDAQRPHVAVGRGDDALHQAELPAEVDAFGRRQRLAGLVEDRDGLAAIARQPDIALGVDGRTEGAALMPPPAKPVVIGESGLPFGSNLVALPCHSASCACQPTVKLLPTQRLPSAVEHRLAAGAIAAAVELQRQHPGARRRPAGTACTAPRAWSCPCGTG